MNKKLFHICILTCISGLIFINTLWNPFMWDDIGLIDMIANEKYQKHLNNPLFFLTASYWKEYRQFHDVDAYVPVAPMRTLSLNLDYKLWKRRPFGYHLTNMILHIINTILVYFFSLSLFVKIPSYNTQLVSLFTGLFFATHPMHTETVAWVKNRVDLITSIFFILSLILFIKYESQQRREVKINFLQFFIFFSSILCYILALLSKEIAVVLPAVLLVYIFCFVSKPEWKKKILLTVPYWFLAVLYVYLSQLVLKKGLSIPAVHRLGIDFYSNILLVFKTVAYYMKLLILPFSFNAERTIEIPKFMIETYSWISVVAVITVVSLAVYIYKKNSFVVSFSIFWFFITISPVSNIIYLAPREIAEQRLYLPSVGFCLLLSWLILKFTDKVNIHNPINLRFSTIAVIMITIIYSGFSIARNFDWRDEIVFWTKTAKSSPNHPRPLCNLAHAYFIRNDIDNAKKYFEKALEISPGFPMAHRGLGFVYFSLGDVENAIKYLQQAGDIE
ncbi:MAG: tetratricopeptide repeat protein [Endomicrobia bacterium]|nr:tetratricopeptide repeat protein [Endomicrobiia bacterium]